MEASRIDVLKLSNKEIRRLTAPFFKKDLDLNQLGPLCEEGSELRQQMRFHPELASHLAEKLGFNNLVDHNMILAPIGRDPRNIFERLSYDGETNGYHPAAHNLLLKIVAGGLPQEKATVIINSIFSPNCRGNFPNLNKSLEINLSALRVPSTPQWVKDLPCFHDRS